MKCTYAPQIPFESFKEFEKRQQELFSPELGFVPIIEWKDGKFYFIAKGENIDKMRFVRSGFEFNCNSATFRLGEVVNTEYEPIWGDLIVVKFNITIIKGEFKF